MFEPVFPQTRIDLANYRSTAGGMGERQFLSPAAETSPSTDPVRNTENTSDNTTKPEKDSVQLSEEAREIAGLAARDREVRAHEAAHAAVGGQYAGAPALTYSRGPDGQAYATSGEVSIDISAVKGDPLATLQKAEIVRAAALAPAQPSAQDLSVASKAAAMAAIARADLASAETPDEPGGNAGSEKSFGFPREIHATSQVGRRQSRTESAAVTHLRTIA